MADIRLGIDPSGARSGIEEIARNLLGLAKQAQQTQQTLSQVGGIGAGAAGAAQAAQQAQALRQQAEETRRLTEAQQAQTSASAAQLAVQSKLLASRKDQATVVENLVRGLQSEDAATRKAAQAQATLLSTFGDASRAASQYAVALSRIETSLKGGIITERQANAERELAAKVFTTGNINAKDLRLNLANLSQGFTRLVSILAIHNPAMAAAVSVVTRLTSATRNLSGGFVLLGPLVGILGAAAVAFGALAVAGDRTGAIPGHLSRIGAGLKELAFRSSEAVGATELLLRALEAVARLLPTPQSALSSAERRLAELRAGQAEKLTGGGVTAERFGIGAGSPGDRTAFLEKERALVATVAAERQKAAKTLLESLDREAKAQADLQKRVLEVTIAYHQHVLTLAQAQSALGAINKEEKQRVASLKDNRDALRDSKEAAREAAAATKAYADAIAGLRAEEDQATVTEQHRLEGVRVSNDLLAKRIEAVKQGTAAVQANNIAEAKALEIQRQRESRANLSPAERQAAIDEAARGAELANQLTDQQKLAGEAAKTWDQVINDIQQGFGNLFVSVLTDGKAAFSNLGSFVKSLFLRVVGELVNAQLFTPLFNSLRSAAGGGSTGANSAPSGLLGNLTFFSGLTNSVSQGVSDAFAKIGLSFGGAIGSANAVGIAKGFGEVGKAIVENLAVIIGGAFIGSKLVGALNLANDTKLEKIALAIGSALGAIAGGVAGSFIGAGGIGAALGGFIVGSAAVGQAQVIQQLSAGKNIFEAPNRLQAINRGAQIGGPIGAIVGGLAYNKLDTRLQLVTAQTRSGLPSLQGGTKAVESVFGFLGAAGSGTGGDLKSGDINRLLRAVAAFDLALSDHLSFAEIELVRASEAISGQHHSNVRNAQKVFKGRARDVLSVLNIPESTIKSLTQFGKGENAFDVATNIGEFLKQRQATLDLINSLRNFGEEATESAKALDEIRKLFEQIKNTAPDFGIVVEDIAQLRDEAIRRAIQGFNDTISDQLLGINNPFALILREETKAGEQRVKEAASIGANLANVEALNVARRKVILEEQNRPIVDLITSLSILPTGQSPLAALGSAESRFFSLVGTPGASRQDIAASAQSFLGLGEQFLGGPTFAAKRDLVLSTLESLLLTLPGTAADTGEQLAGLNLETARGNAANEQLLSRLIDENSSMRNEIVALNTKLDRFLAK